MTPEQRDAEDRRRIAEAEAKRIYDLAVWEYNDHLKEAYRVYHDAMETIRQRWVKDLRDLRDAE